MSLNCREIEELIKEWDLTGAYLQKVKAVTWESFLLSFYKPGRPIDILVTLDKHYRIHTVTKRTEKLGKSHTFVEYLKSAVVGGRVTETKQLGYNRIVEIEFSLKDERLKLLIRLWGGYSNMIVTDSQYRILHLHRNSTKKMEITGEFFQIPDKKGQIENFSLHPHTYESYNRFVEECYQDLDNRESFNEHERELELLKVRRLNEIKKKIKGLKRRLESYKNPERYKLFGDLLLSNTYKINRGDSSISVVDYTTGEEIEITLDPTLIPAKQSEIYYKRYKKAINGLEEVEKQIKQLEYEQNRLISGELTPTVIKKTEREETKVKRPGLFYTLGDWEFSVGRNARENEELLRHWVKGNDMWLHIRDFPGAYVFIRSKTKKEIPLKTLIDGGNLALHYSKVKDGVTADVRYTQVKYLRRVKKGKPGQVIPTRDKNLCIKLDKERLNTLYSSV